MSDDWNEDCLHCGHRNDNDPNFCDGCLADGPPADWHPDKPEADRWRVYFSLRAY